jgi:hypothetical protein
MTGKAQNLPAGILTANDELLNEFEEEVLRNARDAQAKRRKLEERRLSVADPTVNLVSELHDGFSVGYGVRHDPGREDMELVQEGTCAVDIAQELNQHASVVLAGRAGAQTGDIKVAAPLLPIEERARSGLEDLQAQTVRTWHLLSGTGLMLLEIGHPCCVDEYIAICTFRD